MRTVPTRDQVYGARGRRCGHTRMQVDEARDHGIRLRGRSGADAVAWWAGCGAHMIRPWLTGVASSLWLAWAMGSGPRLGGGRALIGEWALGWLPCFTCAISSPACAALNTW